MIRIKKVDCQSVIDILNQNRRGRTWNQLAHDCKINHSVISRIKAGTYLPGYKTLSRLSLCAQEGKREEVFWNLVKVAGLSGYELTAK